MIPKHLSKDIYFLKSLSKLKIIELKDAEIAGRSKGLKEISDSDITAILKKMIKQRNESCEVYKSKKLICVAPDVWVVESNMAFGRKLDVGLAIIDKRRSKPGESEVMNIVGDVAGKDCIILDDIIDSAGTICNAANKLIEDGAKSVAAYITHGVLTGKALERVEKSSLSELVITNSINIGSKTSETSKLKVVSIAPLLGEAIKRISEESSVSSLFEF